MIVLFVPGSFGSTIEYCIRRFSKELKTVNSSVRSDGSMHGFGKLFHATSLHTYNAIQYSTAPIITPTYPIDPFSAAETINEFKKVVEPTTNVVCINFANIEEAERNWLFVYHKILKDRPLNNPNNLALWEYRERISLMFNPGSYLIQDSIRSKWLSVSPDDILFNFKQTIKEIIKYSELTFVDDGITEFYNNWFSKQQYILDEYSLVVDIVDAVLTKKELTWMPISLYAEALVLDKLRNNGIELRVYNLNTFPTTSKALWELNT